MVRIAERRTALWAARAARVRARAAQDMASQSVSSTLDQLPRVVRRGVGCVFATFRANSVCRESAGPVPGHSRWPRRRTSLPTRRRARRPPRCSRSWCSGSARSSTRRAAAPRTPRRACTRSARRARRSGRAARSLAGDISEARAVTRVRGDGRAREHQEPILSPVASASDHAAAPSLPARRRRRAARRDGARLRAPRALGRAAAARGAAAAARAAAALGAARGRGVRQPYSEAIRRSSRSRPRTAGCARRRTTRRRGARVRGRVRRARGGRRRVGLAQSAANGRHAELVPPNEQLAWVYRANGVELSQRHHFQLQEGGCVRHAPRGPRTNRARAPLCSVS